MNCKKQKRLLSIALARRRKEVREVCLGDGGHILSLNGVSKLFGAFRAVDRISLEIRRGEIFSLLGPSGCGKSTTLRLIAGLEQPEEGEIRLGDKLLVSTESGHFVPSQKRNMGMVAQSYAIWPHLTVYDTVAYPLVVRRLPKSEIAPRVNHMLKLVGLDGYETRLAPMLSGGQQQRVALARALVYEPDVLLLDEPFSNLDVKLREQMRVELKLLQRKVGVTVILVTHDQIEALSLSDRIAVMNEGRVEQLGTPFELYEHPRTGFVRDFIGVSLKLSGQLLASGPDGGEVELAGGGRLRGRLQEGTRVQPGDPVTLSIRPESVVAGRANGGTHGNSIEARIDALLFLGDRYECVLDVAGLEVRSYLPRIAGEGEYREGQRIALSLPADGITIWPR
jgi:ABC-type Fe3+/spermidine/putrescine transport system ATPase subunit